VVNAGTAAWESLLDDYLNTLERITALTDTRPVVVLPPPRTGRFFVEPSGTAAPREAVLNDALRRWVAANRSARLVDLAGTVCPRGDCDAPLAGFDPAWRYDGLHVTPDGARWFADWTAPRLVALARPAQPGPP